MIQKIESMTKIEGGKGATGIEQYGDFTPSERAYHSFVKELLSDDTEH